MDRGLWGRLLAGFGHGVPATAVEDGERALCERYDGVFHLVTAADSAERHYTSGSRRREKIKRGARTLESSVSRPSLSEKSVRPSKRVRREASGRPSTGRKMSEKRPREEPPL